MVRNKRNKKSHILKEYLVTTKNELKHGVHHKNIEA